MEDIPQYPPLHVRAVQDPTARHASVCACCCENVRSSSTFSSEKRRKPPRTGVRRCLDRFQGRPPCFDVLLSLSRLNLLHKVSARLENRPDDLGRFRFVHDDPGALRARNARAAIGEYGDSFEYVWASRRLWKTRTHARTDQKKRKQKAGSKQQD